MKSAFSFQPSAVSRKFTAVCVCLCLSVVPILSGCASGKYGQAKKSRWSKYQPVSVNIYDRTMKGYLPEAIKSDLSTNGLLVDDKDAKVKIGGNFNAEIKEIVKGNKKRYQFTLNLEITDKSGTRKLAPMEWTYEGVDKEEVLKKGSIEKLPEITEMLLKEAKVRK